MIIWDSMMTENSNDLATHTSGKFRAGDKTDYTDLFYRQAMAKKGSRAPFLLQQQAGCAHKHGNVCGQLSSLRKATGAAIGHLWYQPWELFEGGLVPQTDVEKPELTGKSLRYLYCGDGVAEAAIFKEHKCEGLCWKARDDVNPAKAQIGLGGSKQVFHPQCVSWHPGWKEHRYVRAKRAQAREEMAALIIASEAGASERSGRERSGRERSGREQNGRERSEPEEGVLLRRERASAGVGGGASEEKVPFCGGSGHANG
jgi:hypothetical protein